ncbi:MAG: pyrrolo-quinoline quinone, partial [Opitutae bacterium]|nr:pyrrolo-quinoline quinone [Opitutae bacterium]
MIPQVEGTSLDWSQWRGPTRDGYLEKESPWPKSISKEILRLSWRKKLGKGYPGPIVSEKLVFTVETKGKNEVVRAFDRESGKQKWETSWPGSMSVPFF